MAATELVITAFLTIMIVSAIISTKVRIPYTLVLVFVGVAISAISASVVIGNSFLSYAFQGIVSEMKGVYAQLVQGGSGGFFVGLVVPPLIFQAMMHIRSEDLKAVVRPSVVLATVGVVIATTVGGILLWQLAHLPPYVSFLFAALIAPTDVVTVLEVFRRVGVPSKLATLMDTEAAFNDATAIVVFSLLASLSLPGLSFSDVGVRFGFTLAGGALIGLVTAYVAGWVSRLIEDDVAKTILTISVVYGSYALAAGIGASGLVAVAVVGLYFGNYTMRARMDPASRETITKFWEVAAFLGNSLAFLFIGFATDIITLGQSLVLVALAYIVVIAARAASVYPILAIFSQIGEKMPISWSNVAMLGGIRGALSIALAASISASVLISAAEIRTISTMVFGVAFFSIILQVPLLSRYVKRRFAGEVELR